ncbi:MAG TPA: 1-deoxy-D-xylulose-5-phosphate synthase, partial [Oscillospiraceae bacterium]|nr:1-deoxy-D-xylulose-5-phosphate synthase [Oscillospiraceae bacterium]
MKLPSDLKKLNYRQCRLLCDEIREILIDTVTKTGGHLASNLGSVELTMAIHRVFDCPDDKIVWDVGHQAYTHKLLTGRFENFSSLRQEGGISGFPKPSESEYDAFISGHSSTSISAVCGIAKALRLQKKDNCAVAVIGDGAFTGGMAYEGLNNAGKSGDNIIIILNHNDMSISKNVGALAKYLTSIRSKPEYLNTKNIIERALNNTPLLGAPLKKIIKTSKSALKGVLYHSTMFEDFGFVYLGPVDGHNLEELEKTLTVAKNLKKPVFVHVNTVKGKGFSPAEKNPGAFHGLSKFELQTGNPEVISEDSFSAAFGKELSRLAYSDKRICAVTAAMKYGTGLQYFHNEHKSRFFDVGIAEQHAITFSAGLAKTGMLPVAAIYSSFLQRGYDQIIHDCSIDKTHIVIGIDRAGIVGEDGETHQGLFDV